MGRWKERVVCLVMQGWGRTFDLGRGGISGGAKFDCHKIVGDFLIIYLFLPRCLSFTFILGIPHDFSPFIFFLTRLSSKGYKTCGFTK